MSWLDDLLGYHEVQDESTPLAQRAALDFQGAGVSVADVAGVTVATIPGGVVAFDWKPSVRCATAAALPANTRTGNVLTADANGALAAVDGVTLIAGEDLLAKDETPAANNGIYNVTQAGDGSNPFILTRRTDCDTDAEVTSGLTVVISEGTANGGQLGILTTADPITLNTTALTFTITAILPAGSAAGQVLVWGGAAWAAGAVDLSDTDAVTSALPIANIAAGASDQVLTTDGFGSTAWAKLVEANITPGTLTTTSLSASANIAGTQLAAAANIAATQLAAGGANQVLANLGAGNVWTGAPVVTSIAATGYVQAGSGVAPADTGDIRLYEGGGIFVRNDANTANIGMIRHSVTTTDDLYFGDPTAGTGVGVIRYHVRSGGSVAWYIGGALQLDVSSTLFTLSGPPQIRWSSGLTPLLYHQPVADAAGKDFTIQAQGNNSATFAAGNLVLLAGANAGAGADGVVSLASNGGNISLWDATGSFGGGAGVLFGKAVTTAPTTSPTGGGLHWWDSSGYEWSRDTAGVDHQITP